MTEKEKEYFKSYKEADWHLLLGLGICLIVLVFIIAGVIFSVGYAIGEYIIPFLSNLSERQITRIVATSIIAVFVYWTFWIYQKVKEGEE